MSLTQVLRRRPEPPRQEPGTAHLRRPRLTTGVRVHPPVADGEPWVMQRGEHQYFRIGADLARLARALDGTGDAESLAARLGPPWSAAAVRQAVTTLDRAHLLAPAVLAPGRHRRIRRWKYVPPLTFQLAVVRSGDAAARRINSLRLAPPRVLGWLVAALAAIGTAVLLARHAQVAHVLGSPVSMGTLGTVLAGVFVTTVAHEFGHACLLAHYGGRPGRMGVMLFYFSPAMFCDVSDSWRLNHLRRAKVSLAGIAVQAGVSGAAASAAGLVGRGTAGDTLLLFALVNAAAAVVNLVPFVKLDGYIALMSYLNRPNLRDAALGSLREGFVALLAKKPYRVKGPGWLPLFGLGCLLTPMVLVVRGLGQWLDALMSLGTFGAMLSSCVAGMLLLVAVKTVRGLLKSFRGNRPRPLRLALLAVLLAALALGSTQLRLSSSQVASYEVTPDGAVHLYVPSGAELQPVRPGDRVELQRAGMMLRRTLGTGTVGTAAARETSVPLGGLIPVTADNLRIRGKRYPLRLDHPLPPGRGSARLHARSMPLPRWAYERLLLPFAAPFH
ncbi:daptide biosynthesis intramembrane metalloprotease [Streptomyces sp. SCSIO ZS0520]|uniref:daptide biosynthesis intramembrane metalloprotease n=1 Tax=Streptomyces sp. SCSIO ZS0520 TaxID=2892996 RepID=UPI0021D9A56F|nr:daptide biosynthesis intramembrane metalloprotease [Streptomyces sp. SCSIO ZS0520]